MNRENLRLWLAFASTKGIGWSTTKRLLQHFNGLNDIVYSSDAQRRAAGLSDHLIDVLRNIKPVDSTAVDRWLEHDNHHVISIEDEQYPRLLKEIADAPLLLYLKGNINLLHQPQIAIVGSRNPSIAGRQEVASFTQYFVEQGLTITSGMALGIDGLAHKTALAHSGNTIAVVATGLDRIYPAQHQSLASEIADRGLLVSELPLGTGVRGVHFPRRNRIISGLTLGTLVIEAAQRSGSLITAYSAIDQGREVFAIPGSIHNPLAKGCHKLIKQGGYLVECGADVLRHMTWLAVAQATDPGSPIEAPSNDNPASTDPDDGTELCADPSGSDATSYHDLSPELQLVMRQIDFAITPMDDIVTRTKMTVAKLTEILLQLELYGLVTAVGGGYQRLR